MSAEDINKRLMREFLEEVWNKGDRRFVDEHFSEEFVPHFLPPSFPANREGLKKHIDLWLSAFPDYRTATEDVVGDEDRVVVRWRFQGTHKGHFMGIPPTGKEVNVTGMTEFRLAEGKIVEGWSQADALGLLVQLGVVSPPGER